MCRSHREHSGCRMCEVCGRYRRVLGEQEVQWGGGVGSVLCRIEGLMTDNVGVTGVVWYLQAVCRV